MKFPFRHRTEVTDWDKVLGPVSETRKQRLMRECKKLDVSIYTDDQSETSSGVYAIFRGVASEVELDRRLLTKKAVSKADLSNRIAILALLVSAISLVVTIRWF